jgi:uncharacterized protein YndB with AHSA1/START domain
MESNEDIRDREIVTTRLMNASVEKVWKVWTDPAHLKNWWGPNGFTNTFHSFELKPRGMWDFTMHGPDGKNYHNVSRFVEIVPTEKLVFDHLKPMHRFRVVTTLEAVGNQTSLTFRMIHPTVEECQQVIAFVPRANEENFDRLELELKNVTL